MKTHVTNELVIVDSQQLQASVFQHVDKPTKANTNFVFVSSQLQSSPQKEDWGRDGNQALELRADAEGTEIAIQSNQPADAMLHATDYLRTRFKPILGKELLQLKVGDL